MFTIMYFNSMKYIRVEDDTYKRLQEHAQADRRSAQQELDLILVMYFAEADGKPLQETLDQRIEEMKKVRQHIVDEGKRLGKLK